MRRSVVALALLALLAGGCAVGPDYAPAEAELPAEFAQADGIDSADGVPPAGLWQSLGNAELNGLIESALQNNTTLRQALATLNETRALSGLAIYSLFPTVATSGEFERSSVNWRRSEPNRSISQAASKPAR